MTDSTTTTQINVTVNGQALCLPMGTSVRELIEQRGFPEHGIAIAVNREVIPRSRHPDHALQNGDAVDVVQAVGGG
jgi:sulfur carrier protein